MSISDEPRAFYNWRELYEFVEQRLADLLKAKRHKRKAQRRKCLDCGDVLPSDRRRTGRCEKCRRKRRRTSYRESKRRVRVSPQLSSLGPL